MFTKKVRKSIPIATLSVLLASCADVSSLIDTVFEGTSSVSDGIDEQGSTEQSEDTENELSSRLDEPSAGVYTSYIDETSESASLAITRLSLNAAREAMEIMLVFEEGNVTRIERFNHCNGQCVDAALKPYAGEPIDGIDNVLSKPATGNFMVTGEYLMIGNSGDYEVNDDYTSFIQVDGKYALDSGGNGYVEYDEGVHRMITWAETVIMSMPAMTEITIMTDMKNTPIPAITDGTGYYIYLIKADFMVTDDVY